MKAYIKSSRQNLTCQRFQTLRIFKLYFLQRFFIFKGVTKNTVLFQPPQFCSSFHQTFCKGKSWWSEYVDSTAASLGFDLGRRRAWYLAFGLADWVLCSRSDLLLCSSGKPCVLSFLFLLDFCLVVLTSQEMVHGKISN